jgi:hypothetical protein
MAAYTLFRHFYRDSDCQCTFTQRPLPAHCVKGGLLRALYAPCRARRDVEGHSVTLAHKVIMPRDGLSSQGPARTLLPCESPCESPSTSRDYAPLPFHPCAYPRRRPGEGCLAPPAPTTPAAVPPQRLPLMRIAPCPPAPLPPSSLAATP